MRKKGRNIRKGKQDSSVTPKLKPHTLSYHHIQLAVLENAICESKTKTKSKICIGIRKRLNNAANNFKFWQHTKTSLKPRTLPTCVR